MRTTEPSVARWALTAPRPITALSFALLSALAALYLWVALGLRGGHAFSGDEPHYLVITQGLWLYHTIDQHRVLYHHDFFAYYGRLMSSHAVHRGAHLYPLHYPGLPLLLLPGFALAGATGAQVTLIAVTVLLLWRALRLATRLVSPLAAVLTVAGLGLSAPLLLNAGAVYPDLLSGLLLILAYDALDTARLTPRRALAIGLLLAAYPWVHVKLLIAVVSYLLWAGVLLWRDRPDGGPRVGWLRSAALALGLPLLSIVALMLYTWLLYGSPSPAAPYQGPTLFTGNPLNGLIGQLFAQAQGALGTAPLLLLIAPGAVALWRRNREATLKIALATVPFWGITLTYRDWWGGDAPPLRYLLPLLPLWGVGIAALLASVHTTMARLAVALLAAVTFALTLAIPVAPRLGWPLPDGRGALLLTLGAHVHLSLTDWLPLFLPTRSGSGLWQHAERMSIVGGGLIAVWIALAVHERRSGAVSR